MTIRPGIDILGFRKVMLAQPGLGWDQQWLADIDAAFAPVGLVACRANTGDEAARFVEQGGLSAAVLWAAQQWNDGLNLVRIIRGIDRDLPCWLIGDGASRWALQEALALRVTSVLAHGVDAGELTIVLQRRLIRAAENIGN